MDFGAQSQFTLGEEARRAVLTSTQDTATETHYQKTKERVYSSKKKSKRRRSPSLHPIPSAER